MYNLAKTIESDNDGIAFPKAVERKVNCARFPDLLSQKEIDLQFNGSAERTGLAHSPFDALHRKLSNLTSILQNAFPSRSALSAKVSCAQ